MEVVSSVVMAGKHESPVHRGGGIDDMVMGDVQLCTSVPCGRETKDVLVGMFCQCVSVCLCECVWHQCKGM